ncbi:MAG: hypothetical protein GX444_03470 [Myxococcales bacterium]|nr:hypothetical protein [Myxococcales bacterium]
MKRLLRGFGHAFKGLNYLLGHRDLWGLALLPILLDILLFAGGFGAFIYYYPQLLHAIVPDPQVWYQWILYALAAVLLVAAFALAVVFGFTAVGCVIAAPFLDALSEKVEIQEGWRAPATTVRRIVDGIVNSLRTTLVVVALFLATEAALLLLLLIPVVGSAVYAVLAPLAGGFFLAVQFFDLPLSRRSLSAGAKIAYLWRRKTETVGFGLAVFLSTLVPLANLLILPVAAIGATLLLRQWEKDEPRTTVSGE